MGKFDDLIGSLTPGEDGQIQYPDNFTEVLTSAYQEDLSAPTAKIEQLSGEISQRDQALAERDAALTSAKAMNYDLLMQKPASSDSEPSNSANSEGGNAPSVSDFFEETK